MGSKAIPKEQIEYVINNYYNIGPKKCSENLNIKYSRVIHIADRFNLKVSKKCNSKNRSLGQIKRFENYEKPYEEYSVNPNVFINCITNEAAYVLGLLWADGYISNSGRNRYIRIECLSSDMEHFSKILNKTGNWNYSNRIRKNEKGLNKKPVTVANISNEPLYEFLTSVDFSEKSTESPDKMISLFKKDNLIKSFILGVIDGDGCFYFNKKYGLRQFTITSSFNQDWNYVEEIFKKSEIKYKIIRRENKTSGYSQIRVLNRENIKKIGDYIYGEETIEYGLQRKIEKFKKIIE